MKSVHQLGNILKPRPSGFDNPQEGRVYSLQGLSPTIRCDAQGRYYILTTVECTIAPNNS